MRGFYLAFPKANTLREELCWTDYRLLSPIEDEQVRSFYMVECIRSNWSTRQLERLIDSLLYQRLAKSRDKATSTKE
jgi:predicted nuclease of restriction endonuclease-like (RecB) superfamily